ncbi:T6SS phospholipase effector Tle1-like catalytic domain-containing protein [Massilia sp. DD77]|uniref:T6SS phospholipase effector Tle1-like catalytic domain-containing protein n=1 Tax=Massilia sp. DD77 TaxID=3109349 RepID=UPI003000B279
MSTVLCPSLSTRYSSAAEEKIFFEGDDLDLIRMHEERERFENNIPDESCKTNLFFGFFFDGTRNNYEKAEATKEHSNVARLYDIFPGQSVPGVLPTSTEWRHQTEKYSHFFRVYIPGVASSFKEVNDSGEGMAATFGGAAGAKGNDRIVWGLIQAINNVHRYFHGRTLISSEEAASLSNKIQLSRAARRVMEDPSFSPVNRASNLDEKPRVEFEKLLRRLHASVSQHWTTEGRPPAKIDPGIVEKIYISMFGFSRGATQARAFANWLASLCGLDAMIRGEGQSSLGGFPVVFDFLGLFDTVASVGLGNTYGNFPILHLFDGHGAWADAEDSLRIPGCVNSCVHLVAGHELRRSFPVDSIAVGSVLPARAKEVVFPGVHSDVGGGYGPTQQGKGTDPDGTDMLSRLPLLYMYREARMAGVPLKLELAPSVVKRRFALAPQTLSDFNDYLSKCTKTSGSLTDIIREQALLQMAWRYYRRDQGPQPLHKIPSFVRATNFDKNDLESANKEFNKELADFEEWLEGFTDRKPRRQAPGFDNRVSLEWEEIATYWKLPEPDPAVTRFFDEYVHDSRSGFKLSGDDSEAEAIKTLKKWSMWLKYAKKRHEDSMRNGFDFQLEAPPDYGMSTNQRIAAEDYDKTQSIPRYITEGREPYRFAEAGYFRFRKIYGGSDSVLLSNWRPAGWHNGRAVAANTRSTNSDQASPETV